MNYDASILMPLQSAKEGERAFAYHRIAKRAKRQLLFDISRRTPSAESYVWTIVLEKIPALIPEDFEALVDDLWHDGILGDLLVTSFPSEPRPSESSSTRYSTEEANLRHFVSVPDAYADIDLLTIAGRLAELSNKLDSYSVADLEAQLTSPLTNAAATARRLQQKSPPIFESAPGAVRSHPIRYRLTGAGRDRLRTLLATVPPTPDAA